MPIFHYLCDANSFFKMCTTYENYITDYAKSVNLFTMNELQSYLNKKSIQVGKSTLYKYVKQLINKNYLQQVNKGKYTIAKVGLFKITPTERTKNIHQKVTTKFPFTTFCIWEGGILADFGQHLAINKIIYVEVEREATGAIFEYLKENLDIPVYLQPNEEIIERYIDYAKPTVFVKVLISEAPVQKAGHILTPTLEKILVDITCDADFFYLRGIESNYILSKVTNKYSINKSKLKRYARRRNREDEFKSILKTDSK